MSDTWLKVDAYSFERNSFVISLQILHDTFLCDAQILPFVLHRADDLHSSVHVVFSYRIVEEFLQQEYLCEIRVIQIL